MSWTFGSVAVAIALSLGSAGARAESAPEPRYGPCRAESVVAGDTVLARCGQGLFRVRLVHVGSPAPGETGYSEATRALRALLRSRDLWLAFETPGLPTLDRDGALLAHLYDRAGQNLNIALVSLGWARYASARDDEPLAASFRAAEREARAEQRAMWSVWAYTLRAGGSP